MPTDEEPISRLLCRLLRYKFQTTEFVPIRELQVRSWKLRRYRDEDVRDAALNNSGDWGSRFEVRHDNEQDYSIRVLSLQPRGRRGRHRRHWDIRNVESSSDYEMSIERCEEDDRDEGHSVEDPSELSDFLRASFAWFSGHDEVPSTERLQYFITHWKEVEKHPACISTNIDYRIERRQCLDCIQNLFMSFEVVLQNFRGGVPCEEWIDGCDRRWYNVYLSEFLATWKLQNYRASWRMTWLQVHLLFQQAVYK